MKRITVFVLLLAAIAGAKAQSLQEFIAQNPDRAAGVLHAYETFDTADAPAPRGYNPFYISHYGRHGSRYHLSLSAFDPIVGVLQKADSMAILSPDGKKLLDALQTLREEHVDLCGILTQLGSRQHQEIAARMAANYPRVFRQKDRPVVFAASSTIQRCIQSMANFGTSLKARYPRLDIRYYTGTRYMNYIAHSVASDGQNERREALIDSILTAAYTPSRLCGKTFTDPERGAALMEDAPSFFDAMEALAIAQNLDAEFPPIFTTYFNEEELVAYNSAVNAYFFSAWCISTDFGDSYAHGSGDILLQDIIDKADAAIAGNDHAADLRFGHDSALTPLLALIGVEGYEPRKACDAAQTWPMGKYMCMGSNLQMIFYRNRAGDVLVKCSFNESDTSIPALGRGPYYPWSSLRPYLLSKIENN